MTDVNNGEQENVAKIQIKMVLKDVSVEMFVWLKEFYNLGYNAEVIRLLIKRDYDRQKEEQT